MEHLTHQEIAEFLSPDYPNQVRGKEKVLEYLLSIGLNGLDGSDNSEESENEKELINLIERVKRIDSKLSKDLLNPNLFKSFISNKVKIIPKVSDDWFIDYRTVDVNNGYMTLTSSDQHIQRVPSFKFFDLLNNGVIDENGKRLHISIIGNRLQGNFIINNQREIYSDHFYNIWKRIHGLDKSLTNDQNSKSTRTNQGVSKEDLVPGRVYKVNVTGDSITLERFLGYKYIVKYQVFDGELIPKITRQRVALSMYLAKFNLNNYMSENSQGSIKNLSPLKKLSYYEELNNLPFIQKLSPDLELDKIRHNYTYTSYFVDVLTELPAPKTKLGFKLEVAQSGELIHVIKLDGKYLFSKSPIAIRNETVIFRPNAILIPDVNNFGKFKHIPLNSREQFRKHGIPTGPITVDVRTSPAYTLKVTPLIEKGLKLNIIDDIMN